VTFTFAAVDEGEQVADAIGNAFDAVLMATKQGPTPSTPIGNKVASTSITAS
jgi:hypothetical protein